MRSIILATIAALALASTVNAATPCKDANGKFIKCPPAAAPVTTPAPAKPAAPAAATPAPVVARTGVPKCVKGKVCGHSCIAISKTCHKPA